MERFLEQLQAPAALSAALRLAAAALGLLAVFLLLWCLALWAHRDRGLWGGLRGFRYAHRGLHGPGRPENSLAALRAAAEGGFGAELDLRLTRDGRLAVFHDKDLRRLCGREGRVEDLTAEELRACRLCDTEEPIPLLEEVLPLFASGPPLLVELKTARGNHGALAEAACALLDRFPGVPYCMESFDPRCLLWLRRRRPQVVRGQLSQDFSRDHGGLGPLLRQLLGNLLSNFLTAPDFIAYRFQDRRRPALRLCLRLWRPGLFLWTLRSPEDLRAAEAAGACGIFEGFVPASPKKGDPI